VRTDGAPSHVGGALAGGLSRARLTHLEPIGSNSSPVWSPSKLHTWLRDQPSLLLSNARTTTLV
jgi:hypothetical protein